MTKHIHFLENKFKLALTEKPNENDRITCGDIYYAIILKEWLKSLIEISNPKLFEEIITMRKGYFECIELKEGDSFELPSNLEFEITKRKDKDFTRGHGVVGGFTANDLRKFRPKAILKLKTEVRSEIDQSDYETEEEFFEACKKRRIEIDLNNEQPNSNETQEKSELDQLTVAKELLKRVHSDLTSQGSITWVSKLYNEIDHFLKMKK